MVTQQFFKLFDCIPQGWKTIIEIRFDTPSLEFIKSKMRIKDTWDSDIFVMYAETEDQVWPKQ